MAVSCLEIVRREVADLTEDELDDLLKEMRRRQQALIGRGLDAEEAARQASKSVGDDLKLGAAIERRNAAINARIRAQALDFVRTQFADRPWEGITALIAGSNRVGVGTRMSADAVQAALKGQYLGGFIGDLERLGLFEVFKAGEMDQAVARALWDIDDPQAFGKHPKTARAIAAIVRKWQERARTDANAAGAWIGKLPGYIVRQGHDADKLLSAGFEAWRAAIEPRLDLWQMFPNGPVDAAELTRWLKEAHTGIVSGIHETLSANAKAKMAGFRGPGNLAKKLSQARSLHFKSADDWFAYNQQFGTGNVREAVVLGLSRSAEATGLMRTLGTNPEANLEGIIEVLRDELRNSGRITDLRKLDEKWQGFGKALLNEVTGKASASASRVLGTAGSFVRGLNNVVSLGMAVLSAFTDVPVRAAEMKYQGQSFLGAISEGVIVPFQRLLEGAESATERKAMLAELGQYAESMTGILGARFAAVDSVVGTMSRIQRFFFKLNLVTGWTDVFRDASILSTAANLGSLTDVGFDKLPKASLRLLAQYGIGKDEWAVLQSATRDYNGRTIVSPEAVREMDARRFSTLAADRINALKQGVAQRIQKRMDRDAVELEWVRKRGEKLQDRIAGFQQRIADRLEAARERAAAQVESVRSRAETKARREAETAIFDTDEELAAMQSAFAAVQQDIDAGMAFWRYGVRSADTVGEIGKRAIGVTLVDQGRALEAMKNLKAAARKLIREEAKTQRRTARQAEAAVESAENRVAREQENLRRRLFQDLADERDRLQQDLTDFADGVTRRIQERAERNAKDLADVEPQVNGLLRETRETVATKLQTLLTDRMNYAIVSPDARAQAVVHWNTQRGTTPGEIARAVMQFKAYPTGFLQRVIGREAFGYGARRFRDMRAEEMQGLARLILATTAFGYIAMTAKDLSKGKAPRDPTDWRTWAAAMQQGGGLGIYGDFLFGEASRFGQGPVATLAGPTVGKLEDLWNLVQRAKAGDDVGSSVFRTAVNNTPFVNLFYTRLALDYLVLWEIQEALNPGSMRRMERRLEQETGQEYLIRPTEAVR